MPIGGRVAEGSGPEKAGIRAGGRGACARPRADLPSLPWRPRPGTRAPEPSSEAQRRAPRLDDAEVAAHLDRALDRAHWAALAPDLGAARPPASLEARPLAGAERAAALRSLAEEGWLRTEPFLDEAVVAAMRRAILRLVAEGWHPVFAYVYDELWQILRTPSIRALVSAALGPGYRQIPRAWAFCVPAEKGAAGWPPHVDGGAATHTARPRYPLDPARRRHPRERLHGRGPRSTSSPPRTPDDFASDMGAIDPETWRAMLQGSRALPARAGSVLAWDFQVVHWSTLAGAPDAPRVSLSVECLGEHAAPAPGEEPLLDPEAIPPFEERLRAIAQGILSYARFEPATIRYAPLARRILDRLDLG